MIGSRFLGIFIAAGLVIASCGGTSTAPTAAPATAAPSAAATAAGTLPKPELTKIRIGLSAPNEPVQFSEKLAEILGLYQKYGITSVEVIGFEGDGKAISALVSGQLDLFA